ncbi:hypothetical protein [Castellaniella sp. UC4442_H9]
MKNGKWTAQEFTAATEKSLRGHLDFLRNSRRRLEAKDWNTVRLQVTGWAFGVLNFWSNSIDGWAEASDRPNLESILKSIETLPYEQ